jgi:hypothetical protein
LAGFTDTFKNVSVAPLPPRNSASLKVSGSSSIDRWNRLVSVGSLVLVLSTATTRFMPQLPGLAASNVRLLSKPEKVAAVAAPAPRVATRTITAWLPPLAKNCCTA